MALGVPVALLTSITHSANATSRTSASITPSNDAFLFVLGSISKGSGVGTITSITDTFSGSGTWTAQEDFLETNNSPAEGRMFCYTCLITGSPGSGTITVNTSVNANRWSIGIGQYTGHDTTTPMSESDNTIQGSGFNQSISNTLTAIGSGNSVIGAAVARGDGDTITTGTGDGEAQVAEISSGSSNELRLNVQTATGTSPDWTDCDAGAGDGFVLACSGEVEEAVAAGIGADEIMAAINGIEPVAIPTQVQTVPY